MEYINLSHSLKFSRIIQGFWRLPQWEMPTADLTSLILNCFERGVTTLDTAEVYGWGVCEAQLGAALKDVGVDRSKYQIVTKTGISKDIINGNVFGYYDTRYDRIINSCKESIKRLGCGYIDLYLIHREDPCIDHSEVARALLDLKKEGYVKEIGVSNFDPFKFNALNHFTHNQLVTNQIEWNPCCFEHFDSGMMDLLGEKGVHPMIWSPLAGGKLFASDDEKYVKARNKIEEIAKRHSTQPDTIVYAWLLYHPLKVLPIVGSRNIKRLDAAIAALEVQLTHREWYELYVASGQKVLK